MKVIVVFSGGMDSTVLLYKHIDDGDEVRALSVNYGQRHSIELEKAIETTRKLDVKHCVADLSSLRTILPGSSQTDERIAVPAGHYSEETMKATVVPNRNMILLSVALGHAIAHKFDSVSYAAHAGDHAIYPDCRAEFVEAMRAAAKLCDWHTPTILSPFVGLTKAAIAKKGADLGVDFRDTYSCYLGQVAHCGKCGTCVERREAIHLARLVDPTTYMTSAPKLEELIAKRFKF